MANNIGINTDENDPQYAVFPPDQRGYRQTHPHNGGDKMTALNKHWRQLHFITLGPNNIERPFYRRSDRSIRR